MNVKQKSKKEKGGYSDAEKVVIVAVRASKEIVRTPLEWALTNVALPGDCIKLLVVIPAHTPDKYRISGRKLWSFSKFTSECTNGSWRAYSGTMMDQREDAAEMCSQMMCQLQDVYDPDKNKISIKVVSGSTYGVVAAEARKAQSNWVILDRHLKFERKCCMEELQCNVVVMKRSQPKVLRLNLVVRPAPDSEAAPLSFELDAFTKHKSKSRIVPPTRDPPVTPISSPDHETSLTTTDVGSSSISSSDRGASPFMLCGIYEDLKKAYSYRDEKRDTDESESDTDSDKLSSPSIRSYFQPWLDDDISSSDETPKPFEDTEHGHHNGPLISLSESLQEKFFQIGNKLHLKSRSYSLDHDICKNVRELTSFSRNLPSASPPLCSICQHKTPMFGKPPKGFTYAELELATSGFAQENFLAEGGYGSVYRGVLPDGQVVAVKQHKMASSQGDQEFCSEVEVLSCAQHRNVVMLIGFCVEDGRRLLVYEYICNGSLDAHLYGKKQHLLEWNARQKIGLGAARGLRYLHEECRVGCIVHRDMRPNNILVTHDFEPLVGDFGLARWQPDGDRGVETRVIGTFGYLAPEYAQTGHVTEKADVYSFGVVLVELITGRKAVDIDRPKGEQCLAEWARPLLAKYSISKLIDPRLGNKYSEQEVYNMVHCASLCIKRDPDLRPRMSQVPHSEQHSTSTSSSKYFINSYKTHFSKSHFSQKVLRILEGDILVNATSDNNASISRYDSRSSTSRIGSDSRKQQNRYYCGQVLGNPTLSAAVSEGLSLARKHTKEHRGQFGGTESVLSRGRSLHKDQ